MPINVVVKENKNIAINMAFVTVECLCSPITLVLFPKIKIHATVAGNNTQLKACERIITNSGRASNIGTTRPKSEITNTIIRYLVKVISRLVLL